MWVYVTLILQIPFLALLRKPHLVLVSLLLVFLVFFIIVFTPLGFPYSDSKASPAPQRFWIYHYQKELDYKNGTRNKSGFLIFSLDRNAINSIKNYVPELSNMTEIEDCDAFFCGIPPSFQQPTWIPGDQPILPRSIGLRLNSQVVEGSMITFNFTAFGAHSMDIYVSPRDGIELQRISVIEHLPRAIVYRRRLVYVIQHHCGKGKKELTFTVSIKKHDIRSLYVLDVAVVGQFLNDKYFKKTKSYEHFLEQFPSWTIIQPCLGSYKSWKF
uniref:Endoplasmic reticulum metallopeptidase 1-like C-terminal domain-containing protein n=1 Tax=Photinus pyralis TaxID=7054 RepID=A0A1Y1MPF3_PHOPY